MNQDGSVKPPLELEQFCRLMHPRLIGALTVYFGDPDLAEELAQEALARVCSQWSKVRKMNSPEGWAHRVSFNLANSYFRRRAAERRATRRIEIKGVSEDRQADPSYVVALRQAIKSLPRRQRAILVLRYYADLPVAEVAEAMDCPEGTVKTLTSRAMTSLRGEIALSDIEEAPDGA